MLRLNRLNKYNKNQIISIILLILVTAGIGFFLVVTPKHGDDFWYSFLLKPWFDSHGVTGIDCGWEALGGDIPHKDILRTWLYHIRMDCGRLANLAAMYFIILPKWFGSSVALAFWIVCMIYSFRIADVTMKRTAIVALAIFIWSFQLPWSEGMGGLDFQFNYLIPSGLMMWYLYWLSKRTDTRSRGWLILAAGVIIGAWHEGFAIPVICGGVAVVAIYKSCRERKYYIALSGLAAGTVALFLCPGMWGRINYVGQTLNLYSSDIISYFLFTNLTYIVLVIAGCVRIRCRGLRNVSPLIIFVIVSGFAASLIQMAAGGERRIGWWRDLISTVGLICLLRDSGVIRNACIRSIRDFAVIINTRKFRNTGDRW